MTQEISEKDVLRRRNEMLLLYKEIESKVFKEGLFYSVDDYLEYEYKNWNKQQKQLKEETIYDINVSKFKNISEDEKKIAKGILCENLITEVEDLSKLLTDRLNVTQKRILTKIFDNKK